MKATELRIGNIITDEFYDDFQKEIIVDSISDKGINTYASDDGKPYGQHSAIIECDYKFDALRGIPLTEVRLRKLGFEKRNNGYFKLTKEHIEFSIWGFDIDKMVLNTGGAFTPEVKYVHQLQNIYFALTGEELKYKI